MAKVVLDTVRCYGEDKKAKKIVVDLSDIKSFRVRHISGSYGTYIQAELKESGRMKYYDPSFERFADIGHFHGVLASDNPQLAKRIKMKEVGTFQTLHIRGGDYVSKIVLPSELTKKPIVKRKYKNRNG
jgi:hypothetical protein